MKNATFYHAGCPVCVNAEEEILNLVDPRKVRVHTVHLGESTDQISAAEAHGVQSVPALVIEDNVLHINFGASLEDLKA
ncbi:MAG: thioredoxin family protein [Bacteroidota bacterium]